MVQDLLNDIDARYRNTFTTDQKLVWMNQVNRQIFQTVRHEANPYLFNTVANQAFYELPSDCNVKSIEQVTIEQNVGKGDLIQLEYRRKDELADGQFYSIVTNNLFLYPVPTANDAGKLFVVYYQKTPSDLTAASTPELEESFQELLILGTLSRIAGARKDAVMKNNYDQDFQLMLDDYQFQNKMTDPEFLTTIDELPRIRRAW